MSEPVSVDDAKDFLKIAGFAYDEKILPSYLAAAQHAVEQRVGPLSVQDFEEQLVCTSTGQVLLNHLPVESVIAVDGTSGLPYATPSISAASGLISWPSGGGPRANSTCTVTYRAGRAEIPANLRQAVLEMLRYLMRGYRAARPGQQGGTPPSVPMKGDLPAVVAALIAGDDATVGIA